MFTLMFIHTLLFEQFSLQEKNEWLSDTFDVTYDKTW